jgi:hypothetical protein
MAASMFGKRIWKKVVITNRGTVPAFTSRDSGIILLRRANIHQI